MIPLEKEFAVELVVVIHMPPKGLLFPPPISRSVRSKSGPHIRVAVDLELYFASTLL